jgi:nicotinate-nucleotide adenylyltransferase
MKHEMKIGVLGGTFDPVHYGHLLLAEDALRAAALDKVLFMPAHIQPFKQDARVTPDADRIEMLRLAVADNDFFDVTEVETSRARVSYTIDSLRCLRESLAENTTKSESGTGSDKYGTIRNGNTSSNDRADAISSTEGASRFDIYFIIGTDMFISLGKWKEHENLLREFAFVAGRRPGYREEELEAAAQGYRAQYGTEIMIADNIRVDISSTEIRRRAAAGEQIRYLTPDPVVEYIKNNKLYSA